MNPGYFAGTRWISSRSNQEKGLRVARPLTAVGLRRASIGPPIMIMVRGACGSPACAISDNAASTGTVGWQTEITFSSGERWRTNSRT